MPIDITIPDSDLAGFSEHAKQRLKDASAAFAGDLIDEANRLEGSRNRSGSPEVTGGMVDDANQTLRRGLYVPKKGARDKAIRIAAAVLPLIVGVMYDKQQLQDGLYLLVFVVVIALAILAATLSVLKE